ncbi:MAG: hypothetical protein GF387_01495 [Candidatus Portnoybacteria bacterium]|nr:hypothetical protein [Candidatus Portnoybacteria bacterium]
MKKYLPLLILCGIILIALPVHALVIPNPLKIDSIEELLAAITEILKLIAIPVATILIVIAGIRYMTAAGNEDKIKGAKKMILYTIIGLAIVLAADFIMDLVKEILQYQE